MRLLPVAVVRLFQYRAFARVLAILLASLLFSSAIFAQETSLSEGGFLARINNDSPEEVAQALKRVEMLYKQGKLPEGNPIAIVLHGPEVEVFFKEKYEEYKAIVDLAQELSEAGVVDVRVCETQTGIMGRSRSSVHPFIGTVLFGPTEVNRLLSQQNYVYF